MNLYLITGILVMAAVTYVIRFLPMVVFRKKINNVFVKSFLYYVPYAVLSAMTFPAIFTCTGNVITGVIGCVTAIVIAYFKKSLLTVAIGSALAVYIAQILFV